MQLIQGGTKKQPPKPDTYFDISPDEGLSQTGYIQLQQDKTWKLYISGAYVAKQFQNDTNKHYCYGCFTDCVKELERLTQRPATLVIKFETLDNIIKVMV